MKVIASQRRRTKNYCDLARVEVIVQNEVEEPVLIGNRQTFPVVARCKLLQDTLVELMIVSLILRTAGYFLLYLTLLVPL